MAKKTKANKSSDTLGDIAEGLGTLLGNAEKQWRAWEGPRTAVVKAVTDVRDRAAALLSEMGAAAEKAPDGRSWRRAPSPPRPPRPSPSPPKSAPTRSTPATTSSDPARARSSGG